MAGLYHVIYLEFYVRWIVLCDTQRPMKCKKSIYLFIILYIKVKCLFST